MTNRARLLACLLPLALAGTGCDISVAAGGAEATFDRELTVSGPVELDVTSGSGDIRVRTGPAGSVQIHGRARTHAGHWIGFSGESAAELVRRVEQNPPIEQSGNRIRVGPREWTDRWNGVSISYVITVPADARVMARSGSGDLEVGNVAGPVDASTGSGDIRVGRTTADVKVKTGSGSIEVDGGASVARPHGQRQRARLVGEGRRGGELGQRRHHRGAGGQGTHRALDRLGRHQRHRRERTDARAGVERRRDGGGHARGAVGRERVVGRCAHARGRRRGIRSRSADRLGRHRDGASGHDHRHAVAARAERAGAGWRTARLRVHRIRAASACASARPNSPGFGAHPLATVCTPA